MGRERISGFAASEVFWLRVFAGNEQLAAALREVAEVYPEGIAVGLILHGASARPRYARRIPVHEREGYTRYVKVEKIGWIEAERQYVRLHLSDKTFLVRGPFMTIRDLASRLDPRHFMQVHRSHIVNLEQIEALCTIDTAKRFAVLAGDRHVPVSQKYWEHLQIALGG